MAVGNSLRANTRADCLRYSRADYLRKLVRLFLIKLNNAMQIIHRSVGEPAEGSLTRYPRIIIETR
jgi:hypothetical protein